MPPMLSLAGVCLACGRLDFYFRRQHSARNSVSCGFLFHRRAGCREGQLHRRGREFGFYIFFLTACPNDPKRARVYLATSARSSTGAPYGARGRKKKKMYARRDSNSRRRGLGPAGVIFFVGCSAVRRTARAN